MGRKNRVDLTPDKSLFKKLGLSGYHTEQAIAELIDNAIDARGQGGVSIRVTLDFAGRSITVDDDGQGMDLESLRSAMTIARTAKQGKVTLGMFGFGMKSACSALGRRITIRTAREDLPRAYSIEYDEASWLRDSSRSWSNFEIEEGAKTRPWHGTQIQVGSLNVPLYPQQAGTFLKRFGERYSQYIKSGDVRIYVNGTECPAAEPELDGERQKIDIRLAGGGRVTGWVGTLKKRSIANYGFNLYRGNRIIRHSDKFGLRNHPELAKLTGEIHLDHVPVNYQKTEFIVESDEYVEARDRFRGDPAVRAILARVAEQKQETIKPFVEYATHGGHGSKIRPSVGKAAARAMIKDAAPFEFEHDGIGVKFDFEDGDGESLYRISDVGVSHKRITVDRNSRVFSMARNPSLLLAMIWEEAKILMREPGKHDEFIRARNESWERFMGGALERPAPARRPQKDRAVRLPDRLADVQSLLSSRYHNRYQFTALSVLEPYLHYAQKNMYYTVLAEKRAGRIMHTLLSSELGEGLDVLYKPTREQMGLFPALAGNTAFIVIREYTNIQASTVASYEKAVLDLYYEHRRGMPIGLDDIKMLVEALQGEDFFSLDKLRRMAVHKNLDPQFYRGRG